MTVAPPSRNLPRKWVCTKHDPTVRPLRKCCGRKNQRDSEIPIRIKGVHRKTENGTSGCKNIQREKAALEPRIQNYANSSQPVR